MRRQFSVDSPRSDLRLQKIPQDNFSVRRQNAFGVELYAENFQSRMLHRHNFSVDSPRRDLQLQKIPQDNFPVRRQNAFGVELYAENF